MSKTVHTKKIESDKTRNQLTLKGPTGLVGVSTSSGTFHQSYLD